jgi:hypothetical protein
MGKGSQHTDRSAKIRYCEYLLDAGRYCTFGAGVFSEFLTLRLPSRVVAFGQEL